MNLKKFLSVLLVLALMCTLFVPCVSADEVTREIPFAIYKECRVQGFVGRDVENEYYLVKSQAELLEVLDSIESDENSTAFLESERDAKYTDDFFEEKAVVVGLYTFSSESDRHSIEKLSVKGNTLYVYEKFYFSVYENDFIRQHRFALMEVTLSDIEGVTMVDCGLSGDPIQSEVKWVYGLRGDADNDEQINVKDATLVQKSIASLHTFAPTTELKADANADGEVNIKDATEIQKYSAGFTFSNGTGYLVAVFEEYPLGINQALEVLGETIEFAEDANPPGSNFVAATLHRLSEEIDKAKVLYKSETPTYEEVMAQIEALDAAIKGLESVKLDTSELTPLMREAQRLIDAGGYTDESLDRLIDANYMGQMACLYGQSQDDVTEAIKAIEEAMAKLVPLFNNGESSIPFTIAEECRVWSYPSSQIKLYLVKSPAQMDEILDTIGGQNTAVYTKPVRDEKYNEAFFEENSLIISLNVVGGGDCFQTIDAVTVKDNVLTVRRTVYQPSKPAPDKNRQYVLIEVKNSDIQGVDTIVNGSSYGTITPDPNPVPEPPKEMITVYFENTLEWTTINVFYWNDNPELNWPGVKMNYLCKGTHGYDLYALEIPADSVGVVFNSPMESVQTEDFTALFDGVLCYPTDLSDIGHWKLSSVDIDDTDILPKPPVDEEPTIPPAPTAPLEEVEFTVLQESRVQGWGELYEQEELEIYLVESVDEMDEVLSRIRGEVTDRWEPKPARDEKFNDEYFAENNLIIALVPLGSGSYTQEVQKLTLEGNVLTIHTQIITPSVSTCDMNYRYLLIEVNPDDVSEVDSFEYEFEYKWIDVEEMY